MNVNKTLATIISIVFSPILTIGAAIIFVNRIEILNNLLFFIVFALIGLLPLLGTYIYISLKEKKFTDILENTKKSDRNIFYATGVVSFAVCYIVFNYDLLDVHTWSNLGILMAIYCGIFFILNTSIDKASMHASAFVFAIVYIATHYNQTFFIGLILLPVIYWARIKLHRHTWLQLSIGTIAGLILGLLTNYIK